MALEMRVEALEGQLLSERRAASELKAQWDAEAEALRHEAEDRGRALEEAERLELNARLQSAAAEHMRRLEQEVSRLKDEHAAELLALEARRREANVRQQAEWEAREEALVAHHRGGCRRRVRRCLRRGLRSWSSCVRCLRRGWRRWKRIRRKPRQSYWRPLTR